MQGWSKLKKTAVISAVGILGLVGLGSLGNSQQNKTNITSEPDSSPTAVQGAETGSESKAEPAPAPTPPIITTPAPEPTPSPKPKPSNCDSNYSGCVPIASDVDCAGGSGNGPAYVAGPIQVIGSDIYGLDRDNNGIACE